MAILLDLAPEVEARLREDANNQGLPVEALAARLISERLEAEPGTHARSQPSGAEGTDLPGDATVAVAPILRFRPTGGIVFPPPPDAPKTGAEIVDYWKRVGAHGAFADRGLYPEEGAALAERLHADAEAESLPDTFNRESSGTEVPADCHAPGRQAPGRPA